MFILNKKEKSIAQAEVLQAMPSTPQFNTQFTPNGGLMPPRQTVSIRAKYNGKEVVFNNLFADLSSAEDNSNGIVVCENKDTLLSEIKAFKTNNENILSQVDTFKDNVEWCDEQLVQLDPVRQAEVQNKHLTEIIEQQAADIAEMKSLLASLGLEKKKGKE